MDIGIGWYGKFTLTEPISEAQAAMALTMLVQTGQVDGGHHKAWTIDQAVRILAGKDYEALIAAHRSEGFGWDEGIE